MGLGLVLSLVIGAGANAATIATNLSATGTVSLGTTGSGSASGTATFTNADLGSGPFTATLAFDASGNIIAAFKISLSGSDTITGTLPIPTSALTGAPTTSTATITGGTGAYANATGSFTITGQLTLLTGALSLKGPGTIITGGSTTPPPSNTPTITAVQDAASYTSNVAEGSIFVVKGSNLSASGFVQTTFPLPTTQSGVKITFTPVAGGSGTDAYLIYLYNQSGVNQLAAVLPSSVATGTYNVTVTTGNGTSAPSLTQVVQRKTGAITQDSTGSGLAVVQNFISQSQLDINRFTTGSISGITISPAHPGQTLIAWGIGMGPVSGGDNTASPGFDFTKNGVNVQVIVGGTSITPFYAGRAPGLAGADQIDFTLPSTIATGCTVPFQISVNGQLSPPTFIAIAPDTSSTACVQPGFTPDQLRAFDNGASTSVGGLSITQIAQTLPQFGTVKLDTAGASFTKYTGFQLAGLAQAQLSTATSGSCTLVHVVGSQSQVLAASGGIGLDAGNITLSGPAASNLNNTALTQNSTGSYSLSIGTEGLPPGTPGLGGNGSIVAGTYTWKGAGGKDVGNFNVPITLATPLTVTGGLPASVTRSAGIPLAWTGGNSTDVVEIVGYSGTTSGSGANATIDASEFICVTTAGPGRFTVPSAITLLLPASTGANGTGFLLVGSSPAPVSFTASGIDRGFATAQIATGANVAYQ
jgi:uncharacterized protein (TIGR03437 family)